MDQIMAELKALFQSQLRDTLKYVATVAVLDAITRETALKSQHYPCIMITPKRESHPQGPFTDTARQIFEITLMVVARSASIEAYQLPPNSGTPNNVTIYVIGKKIREILYANKKLISSTFEMRPRFDVNQIQVGPDSAQSITIEYTELERYDGMQNDQDSLSSPPLTF